MTRRRTLLIAGIAEGLGVELAATFAEAGYDILGLSRSERCTEQVRSRLAKCESNYFHLACDLTRPDDVAQALGPHAERIDVMIHNAQTLMIKPFTETSAGDFEQVWRSCCLGAMAITRSIILHMAARNSGTVIFSGATAARRGGANFTAFASAKFALRGLSQALAREFGPKGVHVAHVVIDGLIEAPQTDRRFGAASSPRMEPQSVARAYLGLAAQSPSSWTMEMDLRPFTEKF